MVQPIRALYGSSLRQRRAGDERERGVEGVQMLQVADVVDVAASNSGSPRPTSGVEHEVVDDELAAALESIEQTGSPVGPSKMYSFSSLTMGSSRRCALSASRRSVTSFSSLRSSLRAASHSSREARRGTFES